MTFGASTDSDETRRIMTGPTTLKDTRTLTLGWPETLRLFTAILKTICEDIDKTAKLQYIVYSIFAYRLM